MFGVNRLSVVVVISSYNVVSIIFSLLVSIGYMIYSVAVSSMMLKNIFMLFIYVLVCGSIVLVLMLIISSGMLRLSFIVNSVVLLSNVLLVCVMNVSIVNSGVVMYVLMISVDNVFIVVIVMKWLFWCVFDVLVVLFC